MLYDLMYHFDFHYVIPVPHCGYSYCLDVHRVFFLACIALLMFIL